MRSLLSVRVDRPDAIDRALRAGADALMIELAGGPPDLHLVARLRTAEDAPDRPLLFLRIPSIEGETLDADLSVLMAARPDGIVLGRCRDGRDVQHLGVKIKVQEAEHARSGHETAILAEVGGTARSILAMDTLRRSSPRLAALVWAPQAFAAEFGTDETVPTDPQSPLVVARGLMLIAARAAEVVAVDGPGEGEGDAFRAACVRARRHGFHAKVAAAAGQVAIINEVFGRADRGGTTGRDAR